MEGLALAMMIGLQEVDAEVRKTEAYALAGQLAVFPDHRVMAVYEKMAEDHLGWLERQMVLGPLASDITQEYVDAQRHVLLAYRTLSDARFWSQASFCGFNSLVIYRPDPEDEDQDEEWPRYLELTKSRIESLRQRIGKENYLFGRMPMPLPVMERP